MSSSVLTTLQCTGNIMVTTSVSDDRSTIVYQENDDSFKDVTRLHRLYGHSYQVFRSLVSVDTGHLVTAGEDGRVITWDLVSGDEIQRDETSGGSPVWSVAWCDDSVVFGAGDGSVNITTCHTGDTAHRPLPGVSEDKCRRQNTYHGCRW